MKTKLEGDKPEYPKVMEVSSYPDFRDSLKRVVFMEKNGMYLAWMRSETLEEAEDSLGATSWPYARGITPEIGTTDNSRVPMLFGTLKEVLNELLDHYMNKEAE